MKDFETNKLSNRMYTFLYEARENSGMTLERMLEISQTTAGACVRRAFMNWKQTVERFVLTPAGHRCLDSFGATDIDRKGTKRPLSKYIASTYLKKKGLTKNVHHSDPRRLDTRLTRGAVARTRRAVARQA